MREVYRQSSRHREIGRHTGRPPKAPKPTPGTNGAPRPLDSRLRTAHLQQGVAQMADALPEADAEPPSRPETRGGSRLRRGKWRRVVVVLAGLCVVGGGG